MVEWPLPPPAAVSLVLLDGLWACNWLPRSPAPTDDRSVGNKMRKGVNIRDVYKMGKTIGTGGEQRVPLRLQGMAGGCRPARFLVALLREPLARPDLNCSHRGCAAS